MSGDFLYAIMKNMISKERHIRFNELEGLDLVSWQIMEAGRVAEVIDRMVFDMEVHAHEGARVVVAHAFYGKPLNDAQEIYDNAVEVMRVTGYKGEVPNMTDSTGFETLRQMEYGLSDEDYLVIEQLVIQELTDQVLATHGISPSQVDLVLTATTMPVHPHFDKAWMAAAGIDESIPSARFCMACNSSGRALAEVLSGTFDDLLFDDKNEYHETTHSSWADDGGANWQDDDQPKFILIIALDDANRTTDKGGDPISTQFFSTGAAVIGFWYHPHHPELNSLQMIEGTHVSRSIEAGTQYLKAMQTYKNWTDEQKEGLYTAKYLKEPKDGVSVEMSQRAGVAFKKYAFQVAGETLANFAELGGNIADIKRVIVHHPSKSVFNGLKEDMLAIGFADEQINWVINEGNVPVATIPIALGRQLEDLDSGDLVMFLSFGAGGEYTCFVARVGELA